MCAAVSIWGLKFEYTRLECRVTAVTKGIINPLLAVFGSTNELGLGVQQVAGKPTTFVAIGPIVTTIIDLVMVAAGSPIGTSTRSRMPSRARRRTRDAAVMAWRR
jgi:large-conductance mechanosensitive channel